MNTTKKLALITWHRAFSWLLTASLVMSMSPSPNAFANSPVPKSSKTLQQEATDKMPLHPIKRPTAAELTKFSKRRLSFSSNPTDIEIFNARVFSEPLVPMDNKAAGSENQALATALLAFEKKNNPEDVSDLNKFLSEHPNSRWRTAIESNIAQKRFETGYLTDALALWAAAWDRSKNYTGRQQKAVADQAVSNLVLLEARLGMMDSLEKHLREIAKRPLMGSVAERIKDARDGLWLMKNHPEVSFKCGPFAVNELAFLSSPTAAIGCIDTIKKAASTSRGTNLAQLEDWAQQIGLKFRPAKRSASATIIVPSVMHWRVGHFAAITAHNQGRYLIKDPTFGSHGSLWLTAKALESQTDGYFLVPNGSLPADWHQISRQEAASVWGKGVSTQRDNTKGPGQLRECPDGICCKKAPMAKASAFSMNATLSIVDYPLQYVPPVGPSMTVCTNYNYNEGNQPAIFTFTNLGPDWSLNSLSYLTVDASQNVTVRVRGGGYELYNYSSGYSPDLTSQAQIRNLGGGSYQRQQPDGTTENFTLSDGTNIYMTSVVDPQGNAMVMAYDADYRVTSITDAAGNSPTTFAYVSNTFGNVGFYKVASITDGFGRSCSFTYDSTTTFLTSITDAAGIVSQFRYDTTSSFINMMTTPYGSTSFYQYTPPTTSIFLPIGLRFTFPDGTSAVIENFLEVENESHYWDREATALYPNDPANHNYAHCKSTRWLWVHNILQESPVVNWVRSALESPVIYATPGEFGQNYTGTSNKPTKISRQLSGSRTTATVTGTVTPGDVLGIQIIDVLLNSHAGQFVHYTVNSGDTLSTIAAGLAAAINSDFYSQAFGITAVTSSNAVIITSLSTNAPVYNPASSGSPTETITFTAGPNLAENVTLGGTVTTSDVLTVTIHDSGLSGGQQAISYTVQANDTLAKIAQNLSIAVNADTQLQALGIKGYWSIPTTTSSVLNIQSDSPNTTTYTSSTSGGATESISLAASSNGIVQSWSYGRNNLGYITQSIDPIGREFSYTYAGNDIDLVEVRETQGADNFLLGHWDYGSTPHKPDRYIDGSGQKTLFTYNSFGELTAVSDAIGSTSTLTYDSNGYLTQIEGPLSGSQDVTDFTFYGYGPVHTITNSQGYAVTAVYDSLNRLTSLTFPDGTKEQTIYDRLDAVMHSDRLGRWTKASYDSMDQIACQTDSLGRTTKFCWCSCGGLMSLTDPANNVTSWHRDLQGRVTSKIYPDQSSVDYVYQPHIGLVQSTTDALNQVANFAYNIDNTLQRTTYSNAVNTTSPVTTAYDTVFPRTGSIENGWGQLAYAYNPYVANHANKAHIYIGGCPEIPNATDTIDATFFNSALSGGQYTMPTYTVASGDAGNAAAVATHLASAITSNSTLSTAGISATASGTLVTVSGVSAFGPGSNVSVGTNPSAITITPDGSTVYVCNTGAGTVTPIRTFNNTAVSAVTVGTTPSAVAVTPSGNMAYVCNSGSGTVTPITTETNTAGSAITVGSTPSAIAIIPDGSKAYVCNNGSGTVTPITTSNNSAGTAITVGTNPAAIAITPIGSTAYVCNSGSGTVTPITTSNNTAGTAITVGTNPSAIAITPNGNAAFVCNSGSGTVTPIATSVNTAGSAITVGTNPSAVAITPNGTKAYVCNSGSGTVTPITTSNLTAGTAITVGSNPTSLAITTDGAYVFVANNGGTTVSVISTATDTVIKTITVGTTPGQGPQGIACMPTANTTYVSNYGSGNVTPIVNAVTVNPAATGSTTATVSGGGRLAQATNSIIANSPTTYSYDALGRTINRMINGGNNNIAWGYDAISRITSEANTLGTFNYAYVDDTSGSSKGDSRLASITYPNSQVTNFSYLPTFQDEQLQQISNVTSTPSLISQFNYAYDATSQIKQWQQQQNSTNVHQSLGYDLASQLTAATNDSGSSFKAYISGTAHTGDVVSVTAYDASLIGTTPVGQETASYTVQSGDSLADIATGLATAIGTAMSNISATASASGQTVTISTSPSYCTQFTSAVTGTGATTTVSLSGSSPIANLHKQLYYSYDCAANRIGVQGDSTGSFPTGLTTDSIKYGYNNVNELVSTAAGGPIAFQATTTNPVKSAVVNVTQTATIGGTITVGDKLWIGVHDAGLSQAENVSYVVQSGDSTTTIATALKNAINADTTLSGIGVTATSSGAVITISSLSVNCTTYNASVNSGATETITNGGSRGQVAFISPSTAFTASPTLASGSNTASVTAVSGGGTAATNTYPITISSAASTSLIYDANGNMTSDGTNSYAWDAENRLITITYSGSGNHSDFTYGPIGNRVKIVETTSGSITSTKQFVGPEERDGSGAVVKQFFGLGQTIAGTNYFYATDHLGSIREMTNSSGAIQSQQSFDPYGVPTAIVSTTAPDFGYAGMYAHQRSGLNLTMFRAYSPTLGRWLSRDPLGESGGINLYGYVGNNPINGIDPLGLDPQIDWQQVQAASNWGSAVGAGVGGFLGGGGGTLLGLPVAGIGALPAGAGGAALGATGLGAVGGFAAGGANIAAQFVNQMTAGGGEEGGSCPGSNGPQIPSKSFQIRNSSARIDVENPTPGNGPGNVHLQEAGNPTKYYIDPTTGEFTGPVPGRIRGLLQNPRVQAAIQKAIYYLNGGP